MAATFDIIAVVSDGLKELRCPAATLATLCDLTPAKLSSFLREVTKPNGPEEVRLRNGLVSLRKLILKADPLPLDLSQAGKIRRSIELLESGQLEIVAFQSNDNSEK